MHEWEKEVRKALEAEDFGEAAGICVAEYMRNDELALGCAVKLIEAIEVPPGCDTPEQAAEAHRRNISAHLEDTAVAFLNLMQPIHMLAVTLEVDLPGCRIEEVPLPTEETLVPVVAFFHNLLQSEEGLVKVLTAAKGFTTLAAEQVNPLLEACTTDIETAEDLPPFFDTLNKALAQFNQSVTALTAIRNLFLGADGEG